MGSRRFARPRPVSADYPLRRVVERRFEPSTTRQDEVDTLDCGHVARYTAAMGSRFGAARRRCRACHDEAYRRAREGVSGGDGR